MTNWRAWVADQVPDRLSGRYRAGAALRDWAQRSVGAVADSAQRVRTSLAADTATEPGVRAVVHRGRRIPARVTATATTLERHLAAMAAVEEALTSVGLPRFAVTDSTTRVRLGVPSEHRTAVIAALQRWATTADQPTVLGQPTDAGVRSAAPVAGPAPGLTAAPALVVGLPVTDYTGQVVLGVDEGVRIDWWDTGPDGSLTATTPNRWADRLPAAVQRPARLPFHGLDLPTLAPLADPHVDDVTPSIDAVYTWVDAADPAWRARYLAAGGRDLADEAEASRYRSLDELRYSLRSLATFAPWVRHVYLVTDQQQPSWLRPDRRLTVVDHRDLWPDQSALPVFNSHAIEARLHHIPGLSEQWLYLNDDVFVGRDLPPERLFPASGGARFFLAPLHVGFGPPGPGEGTPSLAGRNSRAVLAEATGRVQTQKLAHTPHPQLRAVAEELEQRFPAEYERTWRARFRGANDLSPITLHTWYGYVRGRFVPGELEERYFDLRTQALASKLRFLAKHRQLDTFCLNMGEEHGAALAGNEPAVASFLPAFLPFASPWEVEP